jgi:hypothetical protein
MQHFNHYSIVVSMQNFPGGEPAQAFPAPQTKKGAHGW